MTMTKNIREAQCSTTSLRNNTMMMMKNMIGDVTWDYEITFPVKIISPVTRVVISTCAVPAFSVISIVTGLPSSGGLGYTIIGKGLFPPTF